VEHRGVGMSDVRSALGGDQFVDLRGHQEAVAGGRTPEVILAIGVAAGREKSRIDLQIPTFRRWSFGGSLVHSFRASNSSGHRSISVRVPTYHHTPRSDLHTGYASSTTLWYIRLGLCAHALCAYPVLLASYSSILLSPLPIRTSHTL
jgi:hypothetical protein